MITKSKGSNSFFGTAVKYLLSLQMTLAPGLTMAQTATTKTNPISTQSNNQGPLSQDGSGLSAPSEFKDKKTQEAHQFYQALKAFPSNHPLWDDFVQSLSQADSESMKLHFDPGDPAIDRDPFFLRGQQWTPLPNSEAPQESYVLQTKNGVELQLPELKQKLTLQVPLVPLANTDDYLIFTLDEKSDLFEKAAGANEKPGEGFFFLSKEEVYAKALLHQPTPLYYFPLPGTGWKGQLKAQEVPNTNILAVETTQNEVLALDLKDIETIRSLEQIILTFAIYSTWKNKAMPADLNPLPAPGSTAAFGLFFTGPAPELNAALKTSTPIESMGQWATKTLATTLSKSPLISLFGIPKAQAFEINPEMKECISTILFVLMSMVVVSLLLKYKHPGVKRKLKDLRTMRRQQSMKPDVNVHVHGPHGIPLHEFAANAAAEEAPEPKMGLREHFKTDAREFFDVYAHITTTVYQIPSVTFGNGVQMFVDRFLPAVGAADHTLVRRILNHTFYFVQNAILNIPVNAKTFFLSAVLFGSIDAISVVVQYFFVTPWICQAMIPFMNDDYKQRVGETFAPTNEKTYSIAVNDSIKNGLSNLQTGASSYSSDSRTQVIEGVIKDVEMSMRKNGQNPNDPQFQHLRSKMIEEKTDLLLKIRGLPGREEFLFDLNTVFEELPKTMGFEAPQNQRTHESYILARRFALTKATLKRAIEKGRQFALNNPSIEAREAVQLLEETQSQLYSTPFHFFLSKEHRQKIKTLRQQLTLLSYEGPVEWITYHLPTSWSAKTSPEAVTAAALFFRQALFSFLKKEEQELLNPSVEKRAQFTPEARQHVLRKMKHEDPELKDQKDSEVEKWLFNYKSLEFEARVELEILEMAAWDEKQKASMTYEGPIKGWYSHRQLNRAHKKANDQLNAMNTSQKSIPSKPQKTTLGPAFLVASNDSASNLKKAHVTEALAKELGIHFLPLSIADQLSEKERKDYKTLLREVETMALETTDAEISSDPLLMKHLQKMEEKERTELETSLYAINYINAYKLSTTHFQNISPLSPAQPGAFQKWRQTGLVSKSLLLTRALRTAESFFDDESLSLGFKSALDRKIPFFSDLWSSHRRMLKKAPYTLSVSYLWQYFVFNIHLSYATNFLYLATGALTVEMPSLWLNRFLRLNAVRTMDNYRAKTLYTFLYVWLTFAGLPFILLWSKGADRMMDEYISTPLTDLFTSIDPILYAETGLGLVTALAAHKISEGFKEHRNKKDFQRSMSKLLDHQVVGVHEYEQREQREQPEHGSLSYCRSRLQRSK